MPPQVRVGDSSFVPADAHGCPACPHPALGPAVQGSANVFTNGLPSVRVGDNGIHAACCGPNLWTAKTGSRSVLINGRPAHRLSDLVKHCGGTGQSIQGSPNVIVGDYTSGKPTGSPGRKDKAEEDDAALEVLWPAELVSRLPADLRLRLSGPGIAEQVRSLAEGRMCDAEVGFAFEKLKKHAPLTLTAITGQTALQLFSNYIIGDLTMALIWDHHLDELAQSDVTAPMAGTIARRGFRDDEGLI